jgi:GT2 family glycosyltransferase
VETGYPKVAISILNWNDFPNTAETLSSVKGLVYPNYEVWVVDNGSIDGSREKLLAQFPEFRLISSSKNLGCPGGRNLGLEAILSQSDNDYVLFLDNDVILEPRLLDKLIEAAESKVHLGIIGPIVYYHADPHRIWSAGARIVFREVSAKSMATGRLAPEQTSAKIRVVDSITSCSMLVKRQVFDRIGYFNPQYFMVGHEEDFCLRAARQGFATAVVNHASIWHKVSSSTGGGYTPGRAYYTGRSTMLFLRDYGRPWHWVTTLIFAPLSLAVAYVREQRRGNQKAVVMKLRGYLDGLLGKPVYPDVKRSFEGKQPRFQRRRASR